MISFQPPISHLPIFSLPCPWRWAAAAIVEFDQARRLWASAKFGGANNKNHWRWRWFGQFPSFWRTSRSSLEEFLVIKRKQNKSNSKTYFLILFPLYFNIPPFIHTQNSFFCKFRDRGRHLIMSILYLNHYFD